MSTTMPSSRAEFKSAIASCSEFNLDSLGLELRRRTFLANSPRRELAEELCHHAMAGAIE